MSKPSSSAFSFNLILISLLPSGSLCVTSVSCGLVLSELSSEFLAFFNSSTLLLIIEIETGLPPKLAASLTINFSAPTISPVFSLIKLASIDERIF